ncbi:MAG: hypothetical protein QF535_07940 [Anaerolineales bacterium]|nr:hypothetical protein [Anaerolineales bacterium]
MAPVSSALKMQKRSPWLSDSDEETARNRSRSPKVTEKQPCKLSNVDAIALARLSNPTRGSLQPDHEVPSPVLRTGTKVRLPQILEGCQWFQTPIWQIMNARRTEVPSQTRPWIVDSLFAGGCADHTALQAILATMLLFNINNEMLTLGIVNMLQLTPYV